MGIGLSIDSNSTPVIALFCVHAPRGHYRAPLSRSRVSVAEPMAEVPVPIPPDVLVAVAPAAEAPTAAEVPAAGDNPVAPAEEVSWFLSLHCGFLLPASWPTFETGGLTSLLSWRASPCKFVLMAYLAFKFVYSVCRLSQCSQHVSPSELVFRACVASKVASWRLSPCKFGFHGLCRLQVVF